MKRSTPGCHQNFFDSNRQPYICQRIKERFDSSINGNLLGFQNHRKQAKINVVFHRFPS